MNSTNTVLRLANVCVATRKAFLAISDLVDPTGVKISVSQHLVALVRAHETREGLIPSQWGWQWGYGTPTPITHVEQFIIAHSEPWLYIFVGAFGKNHKEATSSWDKEG